MGKGESILQIKGKAFTDIIKEEEQLKRKQELERELKKQQKMEEQLKREAEAAKKRMEAEQEALKIQMTCLKIAGRIIAGDKVPTKDHQYLVKHDSKLYGKALMMRVIKEEPKEYKQLSEEEERNNPLSKSSTNSEVTSDMNEIVTPTVDIQI